MQPSHGANLLPSDYSSHNNHPRPIRLIPACSAGPGSHGSDSFCRNGRPLSEITESSIHSHDRFQRERAQLTGDDVSSIQTYDNLRRVSRVRALVLDLAIGSRLKA